ncbi:MAG TPA: OmpA family protein [Elusimicrobiota bacterium]|jgi:outer membrane protein OmpA-like peptidoglycan-associated protein|nr:OmpA family protein [Elusimicrobiota bacterium]
MKALPLVMLLAALWACSRAAPPILIDDDRPAKVSAEDAERQARAAIRDIEDRISRGDLPKIQFDFDKAELRPESLPTLDLIAQIIVGDPRLKLMIFAHTDDIGSDEYNLDLSQRRAKSVSFYLASKGVPPPSMRFRGFGASKPIASNATEEGRAKNRRVEFDVTTREWKSVY